MAQHATARVALLILLALSLCSSGCYVTAHQHERYRSAASRFFPYMDPMPPAENCSVTDPCFFGHQTTCWYTWPSGWMGCPPCVIGNGPQINVGGEVQPEPVGPDRGLPPDVTRPAPPDLPVMPGEPVPAVPPGDQVPSVFPPPPDGPTNEPPDVPVKPQRGPPSDPRTTHPAKPWPVEPTEPEEPKPVVPQPVEPTEPEAAKTLEPRAVMPVRTRFVVPIEPQLNLQRPPRVKYREPRDPVGTEGPKPARDEVPVTVPAMEEAPPKPAVEANEQSNRQRPRSVLRFRLSVKSKPVPSLWDGNSTKKAGGVRKVAGVEASQSSGSSM